MSDTESNPIGLGLTDHETNDSFFLAEGERESDAVANNLNNNGINPNPKHFSISDPNTSNNKYESNIELKDVDVTMAMATTPSGMTDEEQQQQMKIDQGDPKSKLEMSQEMMMKGGDLNSRNGNEFLLQDLQQDEDQVIFQNQKMIPFPKQTTMISLDPLESRCHRLDVLWKLPEGCCDSQSTVTGAVIPNLLPAFSSINYKNNRIIPNFNHYSRGHPPDSYGTRGDELLDSPADYVDPNQNQLEFNLQVKKSEENHLERSKNDGATLPMEHEALRRRPKLNWPWHSGRYQMNIRFHDPPFRTRFSSKILFLKALQWAFVTGWILLAKDVLRVHYTSQDLMWTLYLTVFFFLSSYAAVRTTNFMDSGCNGSGYWAYVILCIYAICLSHLLAAVYVAFNAPYVPLVTITLAFTYFLCGCFFVCFEIDFQSRVVYYPMIVFTLIGSIVGFWLTFMIRGEKAYRISEFLGTVWLPCLLFCWVFTAAEVAEIQAIIEGSRLPLLRPTDWVIGSTFII